MDVNEVLLDKQIGHRAVFKIAGPRRISRAPCLRFCTISCSSLTWLSVIPPAIGTPARFRTIERDALGEAR